jgi:hypothetical protein
MAGAERPQRFSVGFHGGQTLAGRAAPSEISELRKALGAAGSGFYDLKAEDATIALDLGSVAYLLVDVEDHRVGFGS